MREFHIIIEHSYVEKKKSYTFRFQDGTCLHVPIKNLPREFQKSNAIWESSEIAEDKSALIVPSGAGKRMMKIPSYVLLSSGKMI